jgi:hypothetical protein
MFIKKLGSMIAMALGVITFLSAVDAEAGRGHRHRRSCCCEPCPTVCCDPCPTTCYDPCPTTCCDPCATACPAPCTTTWCDPCRGTIVIQRAVVSSCCMASASTGSPVIAAAEQPASGTTAVSVTLAKN